MREVKTLAEYNEAMADDGVVIVKFGATWCAPCKALNMILEREEEKLKEKGVRIIAIDIDNAEFVDVMKEAGVRSVPQMTGFEVKDGKATFLSTKTGLKTAADVQAWADILIF